MTDRDRLAADLQSTIPYPEHHQVDREKHALDDADYLIALGWTLLPQDERAEWYHMGRNRGLRDIDEERLARALDRCYEERWGPTKYAGKTTIYGSDAADIAKAYREDTDDEGDALRAWPEYREDTDA